MSQRAPEWWAYPHWFQFLSRTGIQAHEKGALRLGHAPADENRLFSGRDRLIRLFLHKCREPQQKVNTISSRITALYSSKLIHSFLVRW